MTTAEPPPPGKDPDDRTDRPALSEEDWAAFQRDLDGASRKDAPKEPSARARLVAERLRRLDEEQSRGSGSRGNTRGTKRRRKPLRRRTGRSARRQRDPWRPASAGVIGRFRANGTARAVVVFAGFLLVMLALSWLLGPARY